MDDSAGVDMTDPLYYRMLENILVEKYPKVTLNEDTLFTKHVKSGALAAASCSSASQRRQRRNRMSSRFKTQPITFTEIKEVDEENTNAAGGGSVDNSNKPNSPANLSVSESASAAVPAVDNNSSSLEAIFLRSKRSILQPGESKDRPLTELHPAWTESNSSLKL